MRKLVTHDDCGPGPTVLWVHPYTLDGSIWAPLWALLPGWRHLAVDLPGHGGSPPLSPGDTLAALGAEVAQVAATASARHLVGLSFGSSVALQATLEAPELFASLTLAAPALVGWPTDPAAEIRYGQLRELLTRYGPGPHMTRLWMSSPPDIFLGCSEHPAVWVAVRELVDRHRWSELLDGSMLSLASSPQTESLTRVRCPSLVVVGERDMSVFRQAARRLQAALPRCRAVQIPATGHLPLLERPELVSALLQAHLGSAEQESVRKSGAEPDPGSAAPGESAATPAVQRSGDGPADEFRERAQPVMRHS